MVLTLEKPSIDTLRASFNYIVHTGVPRVRYIDWPEMEHNAVPPQYRQHEMVVRNGRPLRDTFDIDTHGFVFVDHTLRVSTEEGQKAIAARPTVKGVHNDYTEASAPVRLREIVGEEEAARR